MNLNSNSFKSLDRSLTNSKVDSNSYNSNHNTSDIDNQSPINTAISSPAKASLQKDTRSVSYVPRIFDRDHIRGQKLNISPSSLTIGSWNIEGFIEAKKFTIQHYMDSFGIHILCIQETHRSLSDYFVTEEGFLRISSGNDGKDKEYAGVGFVISSSLRRSAYGFT